MLVFVTVPTACGGHAGQEDIDVGGFPVPGAVITSSSSISLADQQQDVVQSFSQSYSGLAYDAFTAGFFLQIGLGFGEGDFPNPILVLQCGNLPELRYS